MQAISGADHLFGFLDSQQLAFLRCLAVGKQFTQSGVMCSHILTFTKHYTIGERVKFDEFLMRESECIDFNDKNKLPA